MLIELFIFFEIVVIVFFGIAFFTKHEIVWALAAVFSGILMFTSYNVEIVAYQLNTSSNAYFPVIISNSYPYLVGINLIFFALALVLGIFDLFDKYGSKFVQRKNE